MVVSVRRARVCARAGRHWSCLMRTIRLTTPIVSPDLDVARTLPPEAYEASAVARELERLLRGSCSYGRACSRGAAARRVRRARRSRRQPRRSNDWFVDRIPMIEKISTTLGFDVRELARRDGRSRHSSWRRPRQSPACGVPGARAGKDCRRRRRAARWRSDHACTCACARGLCRHWTSHLDMVGQPELPASPVLVLRWTIEGGFGALARLAHRLRSVFFRCCRQASVSTAISSGSILPR